MITYRKTRDGQWVAYGPASEIKPDTTVTVTKKNGETKEEYIESVGKPFTVDGTKMVYGYIGTPPLPADTEIVDGGFFGAVSLGRVEVKDLPAPKRKSRPRHMCDACGERRGYIPAVDMSGLSGLVCAICDRSGGLSFA